MAASFLRGLVVAGCAALFLTACATEDAPVEDTAQTDDELRSAPLENKDMVVIPTPAGMPEAWAQPDSTGWFDERGKCGPTALANTLRLYSIELSPDEADDRGVNFVIGTLQWQISGYLKKTHPELDCRASYAWDGAKALRENLDAGRPVMVWFNTDGGWNSHWVTAVGTRGEGADEKVIVMSWGRYYEISMKKLTDASKWVYGLRHPTVTCEKSADRMVR